MENEFEFQSSIEPPPQSQEVIPEPCLVGFILANIVGLRYYNGRINGREMVGLVREPLNRYDENAIRVLNTRSLQVGHIERTVAAVLSPLIDSNMINIEGIVPNTRSSSNRFKISCQIHVFAKLEELSTVESTISRAGLVLISESDVSFGLSEAVVVRERMGNERVKSVDKIFQGVGKNMKLKEILVEAEPPREVIKSELFAHQKEGLGWLLHREKSEDLPPFWEEKDGEFLNILTNYRSDKRPEPLCGGIFADDMGLGKTLTLLSLIACDRFGNASTSTPTEEPVDTEVYKSEKKGKKRVRGNSSDSITRKKMKLVDVAGMNVSKTTLIVCPPSVFSAWITQLEEHTVSGSLKVYMYHGGERTDDANELMKYDIVLTTYSILAIEELWEDSPVKKIEWLRIILDEAHTIKNSNARQSQAVCNLKASRRWAVTGTPIQNGSIDLYSLMAFLRFEPFSIKSYWQSLIQRQLGQGNRGLSRLLVLMASISLRRTKETSLIGLPPKVVETCYVELSPEERQLYDQMEGEAKGVVQNLINSGSLMRNYSTILSIILRLRQLCDDISLCPPELRSFATSTSLEDVTDKPELLQKLVAALQDGEDFDCPICISPPKDIIITRCAHIFCKACILQTLQRSKPLCPLCRGSLTQSDLYNAPPPPDTSNTDEGDITSSPKSSKVTALLSLLMASREENPNTKSVVFSQFRKMLLLLEVPLKAAGFTILRLDGTMPVKKRTQVIGEFGNVELTGPVVLLASLKASGTGINLTAASRVYLFEPWWNPAVEEQAMDRIHRIGQKQEVKMIRMIARNSIEERVLQLQEKKKNLAREAFKRRYKKDQKEVNFEDVIALMSL